MGRVNEREGEREKEAEKEIKCVCVGRKTSETKWQGGEGPGPVGQKFSGCTRLWLGWGKGRRERLRHPHPA